MLKEALRRLLWLAPTLFVVTIPTFWALSRFAEDASRSTESLPLFFNARPSGAKERALAALAHMVSSPAGDQAAARTLVELGGAALPHVLPQFDTLAPDARRRVALALVPIAKRMGVGQTSDFESPESAILFFSRFWDEHAIDFRPAVVRRVVRRFAEHPSALRRMEVVELDSFALPDLIDAMRPLKTDADVTRARHVCDVAAHVGSRPWRIPPGASLEAAKSVVATWEDHWLEHRGDYVAFTGTSRLAATFRETRYGHWVERTLRGGFGTLKDGNEVLAALRERGPTTLWLLLVALFIGYPAAAIAGAFAGIRRGRLGAGVIFGVACGLSGITTVGVAVWLSVSLPAALAKLGAAVAMASGTFALACLPFRDAVNDVAERPWLRAELAIGASPFRVALRNLRYAGARFVALALSDFPGILTAAFVVERAFSLRGVGDLTVSAVRTGDLAWLMSLAFLGTLAAGLSQIASDLVLSLCDPRVTLPTDRARRVLR
jgi:ABC-type dipeptide/oligopeptide/nickel transport system permease component